MRIASLLLIVLAAAGCGEGKVGTHSTTSSDQVAVHDDLSEVHVVMETLDRPGVRKAMPAVQPTTLDEYCSIRDKYIANHPAWRPGFAFTYRVQEEGRQRTYHLALVSFDPACATIAERAQFRGCRSWDWIAVYRVDRCREVEADFGIWGILADRARVIGGVRYGMKVVDVIAQKGRHFRVNPHAEAGSAELVYDDVKVSVRQWWPGADQGRVVGVAPVTDSIAAHMENVPYEDER